MALPENRWRTLGSEVIYENPWIKVRHDRGITPAGSEGIYGVVEAKPAVGVVALTGDLQTYLVGQWRYPHRAYSWEIPEGGARPGEGVEEAARRELREETGLSASRWETLGTLQTSNCFTDEVAHLFLAEGLTRGEASPDGTEDLQVQVVPFLEAFEMARRGDVQDAMSVVALYRAHDLLAARHRI